MLLVSVVMGCVLLLLFVLAMFDAKQKRLKRQRQIYGLEVLQSALEVNDRRTTASRHVGGLAQR